MDARGAGRSAETYWSMHLGVLVLDEAASACEGCVQVSVAAKCGCFERVEGRAHSAGEFFSCFDEGGCIGRAQCDDHSVVVYRDVPVFEQCVASEQARQHRHSGVVPPFSVVAVCAWFDVAGDEQCRRKVATTKPATCKGTAGE